MKKQKIAVQRQSQMVCLCILHYHVQQKYIQVIKLNCKKKWNLHKNSQAVKQGVKFAWNFVIKNFTIILPSQPLLGHHLGFHNFFMLSFFAWATTFFTAWLFLCRHRHKKFVGFSFCQQISNEKFLMTIFFWFIHYLPLHHYFIITLYIPGTCTWMSCYYCWYSSWSSQY